MPVATFIPRPRPEVAAPLPWQYPAPELLALDSGLTVYLHDLPGQHVATIACHLRARADDEPAGLGGVSGVMAALLGAGTRHSAARLAGQAAAAGMTWSSAAAYTGPVITCRLPARHLAAGLHLLARALSDPEFGEAETARETRAAAARAAAADMDPAGRLMRLLPAAVYGDGPAGRPPGGTARTLARITAADVRACYDARARPSAVTVVIAGDLGGGDAAGLASAALGGWRDPRPPGPATVTVPPPLRDPAAVLAARPGAAQARLLLAARIPGRGHRAWPALAVAAHLLGAPVTGKLDARLRERDGITYGITASLAEPVPGSGLLLVSGAVDAGHAVPALAEITAIISAAARDGLSSAEVTAAARGLTRSLPLAYESAAAVAAMTCELAAGGLPPGFPARVLSACASLAPGQAAGALHRCLPPGGMTVLADGDPDILAAPLATAVSPARLDVT